MSTPVGHAQALAQGAFRGGGHERRYSRAVRDAEIRSALHARLVDQHGAGPSTRYVDELGLCGVVRVDVAVINGTLSGYELKSDRDTLRRLPTQVTYYSRVLDHATVVVGELHFAHQQLHSLVPDWWGLMVATERDGQAVLEEVRASRVNNGIDAGSLSQLLWKTEVLAELAALGLDDGVRSKPRRVLYQRLVDSVPLGELRAIVRRRLKAREAWRQPRPRA